MIARNRSARTGLPKPARRLATSIPATSILARSFAVMVLLCLQSPAFAHAGWQGLRIEGVVMDQAGAPVSGAEVTLSGKAFTATQTTNAEGRFIFDAVSLDGGTLRVRGRGFATVERAWSASEKSPADLNITLAPAPVSEQITVTAERTETRLSDTAASVLVLSSEDISTTAALTLDDALRQVPGFSLFRRSGSRTANPTSQGVSLRAVGASGASRAVVLADGIPLNDPFGGWVYWGRAPRESIGRVEVVQGGSSHLYGTDALGGVINFITRESSDAALSLEASYGNQQTPDISLFASGRRNGWGAQLAAEAFHTDGYILVDEAERGRVDTRAGAEHTTLDLRLERFFSDKGRAFLRGSVFGETRENGTPLQQNRTHIRQLAAGGDWQAQNLGSISARAYGGAQVFDQDFSAIAADRDSEALTRSQRVPAQQLGASIQWSRAAGSRQTLVAGLDAREVRGASDELVFVAGRLTSAIGAGGRERSLGVFAQDIIRITSRWFVTVGARADRWRNFDALSATRPLAQPGPGTVTMFADRTETAFSPRLSILHKLTESVSFFLSGYRAFRAPTLNELYRSFRVGNVLTLANDKLRAERLTGGEAGARFAAFNRKLNVRGTFFWSEITRPIANVTLAFAPDLITRQRQNLGRTRSRGLELEAEARLSDTVTVSGGYQFADATVLRFPANTSLEGLLIPQVARHQMTFQARYSNPERLTLAVQGRAVGAQFDDDQNRFRLDRFFALDALVSRRVMSGVELFAAAENLFNQRYDIGRTPVRTLGPPLLARFGVRLRLGAR
jgi:outer membrane receptor protein involved in Fe transport